MFGGVIEAASGSFIDYPAQAYPRFFCRLVDYSWILDKRRLAGRFYDSGLTLNAVVFDVWSDFLNAEGIPWNTSYVDYAPVLTSDIESNTYETIAQFFTRLANLTGRQWWVDFEKYVHFAQYIPASAAAAPINIAYNLDTARNISVSSSRTQYRNRQWVRAGVDVINSFTDSFTATASQDLFVTTYRMDALVSITIDGDPATFSLIEGLEAFFYVRGSDGLYRDQHAEFSGGEEIIVMYQPPASNVISAQDDAAIAARAVIEGGTGIHEAIDEMSSIVTQAEADAYAEGMVRRFGASGIPLEVKFESDTDGIEPGQKLNVNIPNLGVSNENLIISDVQARCVLDDLWRYNVTCVRGESLQSWDQYLNRVVEIARQGPDAAAVAASAPAGGSDVWACWVLAEGADATVGADKANPVPIQVDEGSIVTPIEAVIIPKAGDEPTGTNFIVDINYCEPASPLSGSTIFGATKLVLPPGSSAVAVQSAFASPIPAFIRHGWLTIDIDQIGSTVPGRNFTVLLRMRVT